VVVIAVHFAAEDLSGLLDQLHVFPGAGADQAILEPAVRTFDLTFGLRREGVERIDPTVVQDPLPLGVDVVGDQVMFSPDGIPALDKAENRVGVGVISVGGAIAQDDAFQGRDVVPAGFLLHEFGVEELTTIIIQAGDEMPFLVSKGAPFVVGRVVLNKLSDVTGEDFPVMGFALRPAQEVIVLLGPADNRRHRNLLAMFLPEQIPDVAVVIGMQGDLRAFYQFLLPFELGEDVVFDLGADHSGFPGSLIGDGKPRGVGPILLEQLKESAAADFEDIQDVG